MPGDALILGVCLECLEVRWDIFDERNGRAELVTLQYILGLQREFTLELVRDPLVALRIALYEGHLL